MTYLIFQPYKTNITLPRKLTCYYLLEPIYISSNLDIVVITPKTKKTFKPSA